MTKPNYPTPAQIARALIRGETYDAIAAAHGFRSGKALRSYAHRCVTMVLRDRMDDATFEAWWDETFNEVGRTSRGLEERWDQLLLTRYADGHADDCACAGPWRFCPWCGHAVLTHAAANPPAEREPEVAPPS